MAKLTADQIALLGDIITPEAFGNALFGGCSEEERSHLIATGESLASSLKEHARQSGETSIVRDGTSLKGALEYLKQPPLRFDPSVAIKDDNGKMITLLDLMYKSRAGMEFFPLLLDSGLSHCTHLADADSFLYLCNKGAPAYVAEAWLQHFPHYARYVPEESPTLIDIAVERLDAELLDSALKRGADVTKAKMSPIMRFDRLNQMNNSGNSADILKVLLKHGELGFRDAKAEVLDPNTGQMLPTDDVSVFSGLEGIIVNKPPYVRFIRGLLSQAEQLLKRVQNAAPDERATILDGITVDHLNLAYGSGRIDQLCQPDLWEGKIDKLYALTLQCPANVQRYIRGMAGEALHAFEQSQQPERAQVSGPFELGEPLADKSNQRGGGDS